MPHAARQVCLVNEHRHELGLGDVPGVHPFDGDGPAEPGRPDDASIVDGGHPAPRYFVVERVSANDPSSSRVIGGNWSPRPFAHR